MMRYTVDGGSVFFGKKKIPQADPATFRTLGSTLAADRQQVYHNGRQTPLDPESAVLCGDLYVKDHNSVYLIMKAKLKLLNADAASFTVLNEFFARDKSYVLFLGKRIQGKHRHSFGIIEGPLAWDRTFLYCGKQRIEHRLAEGQVPRVVRPEKDKTKRLVLLGDSAAYIRNDDLVFTTLLEGVDPETIRFVHGRFLADKNSFYYMQSRICANTGQRAEGLEGNDTVLFLDRRVFLRAEELEGAHRESFASFGEFFYDKNSVYHGWSFDDTLYEKVERVKRRPLEAEVPVETARRDLDALWRGLFFYLDRHLPVESPDNDEEDAFEADIPDYTLDFHGPEIRITCRGRVVSGRFSAFLLLGGEFWALAREVFPEGHPVIRLLFNGLNHDSGYDLIDRLQKRYLRECLRIALFFHRRGEVDEANLITHKLLRDIDGSYWAETAPELLALCPEILLEGAVPAPEISYKAAAIPAAMREVLQPWQHSERLDRLARAGVVYSLISTAQGTHSFFGPMTACLPELIEKEECLHIREILFQAAELSIQKLHRVMPLGEKESYRYLYPLIECQLRRGINADLNRARLWETACVLGRDSEAAEAERKLSRIVESGGRGAPMGWLLPDYPDYRLWRLDARLRIATFQEPAAAGAAIAAVFGELDTLRVEYSARFNETFRLLQQNMVRVCRFHSLPVPFEDLTDKSTLSGVSNMIRTGHSSRCIVSGTRILGRGLYRLGENPLRPALSIELIRPGKELALRMGESFGLEFVLDGQPWGRELDAVITVSHPGKIQGSRVTRIDGKAYVGVKNSFFWTMERPEELLAGKWKVSITFPDPAVKGAIGETFRITHAAEIPPAGKEKL